MSFFTNNQFYFDNLESVLRNKHINSFEASFLLAYSIYTREKDALVYSFTDSKDKLNPLHPIMPKSDFKMAKEAVQLQAVCVFL